MVEGDAAGAPDFRDQKAAKVWLQTQSRAVSVAIAAQAALRVLPLVGAALGDSVAPRRAVFVLPRFRAASIAWFAACVSASDKDMEIRIAADAAAKATRTVDGADAEADAAFTAFFAASAVSSGSKSASYAAYAAAYPFLYTSRIGVGPHAHARAASFNHAAKTDAAAIVNGTSPESLARGPLWPDGPPEWAQTAWTALKSHLLAANEGWEVWTDWYEARLRGDPFDPDLERARVLIDEAIWKQGPKAVNAEIARLIAAHRAKAHENLMQRVANLETMIALLKQERSESEPKVSPGLGHNNPPEAIDEVAEDLQADLDVLQAQPIAPDDPASALAAVHGLKNVLSRLTGYVAKKLDLFITEAAKEGGKKLGAWTVRLVALGVSSWAINLSFELARVVDAAVLWLRSLGAPI